MVDVLKKEKNNTAVQTSKFNDRLTFNKTVWIFFISCEVGWLVETIWCLIRHRYIESRQSLVYSHLSGAAAFRMDRRDAGIPASNAVSEYLDNHFDDERMHKIYANSKDVVK